MTRDEFNQEIQRLFREFERFELSADRGDDWFREFQKHSAGKFRAMIRWVLFNSKYTPSLSTMREAEAAVGGRREAEFSPRPGHLMDYDKWLRSRGVDRKGDGRCAWYESAAKLDVILEVYGHAWVNKQLGLGDGMAALAMARKIASGSSEKTRFEQWKDKAFRSAWVRKFGCEVSDEDARRFQ